MQFVKIVLLSVLAAICYGIVHDQITARICVEYFTIGHPPVFDTVSPTLLGLGWGIIATWWVGLLLGIPLAIAARCGRRTKTTVSLLLRPLLVLLAVMGLAAVLAGCIGWFLGAAGSIRLTEPLASLVPPDKHILFLIDAWTHWASYLFGFVGGFVLIVWTWCRRSRQGSGG